MKIEIWNEPNTTGLLRLRLADVDNGEIELQAVDGDGDCEKILIVITDKGFELCEHTDGAGLPVDKRGRVKIVK